jgi:hypothetical protein
VSRKNSSGSNINDQIKNIFTLSFAIVGDSTSLVQFTRARNRSGSVAWFIWLFALEKFRQEVRL